MNKNLLSVYLTNLGKYNEGYLVGEWVDLPVSEEELQEVFKRIGINEEYEEYFITDYESNYGLECGEYENIFKLNENLQELDDKCYNESDYYKIGAIIEKDSCDLQEVIDTFDNYGFVEGWTAEEYEEDLVNNCYPEVDALTNTWIDSYITIDYEAMARDDYSIHETEYGVLYEQ